MTTPNQPPLPGFEPPYDIDEVARRIRASGDMRPDPYVSKHVRDEVLTVGEGLALAHQTIEAGRAAREAAGGAAEELPRVLEDPDENRAWHEQQAKKAEKTGKVAPAAGGLSIAAQNAAERRNIEQHKNRVTKQILDPEL